MLILIILQKLLCQGFLVVHRLVLPLLLVVRGLECQQVSFSIMQDIGRSHLIMHNIESPLLVQMWLGGLFIMWWWI